MERSARCEQMKLLGRFQQNPVELTFPACNRRTLEGTHLHKSIGDTIVQWICLHDFDLIVTMHRSSINPKKARLLCVDDDPRFLLLFTTVLETAGYNVVATNYPCNALQLAAETAFDLVIVDYDMPHMNGAELACQIKQHKSDLPIILFSGNASLPAHALSAVDDYVVKGGTLELLLHRLNHKVHTPIQACEHHNSACSGKNEAGTLNREPLQKLGPRENGLRKTS
jgi:CheY-like chemotaxis protein